MQFFQAAGLMCGFLLPLQMASRYPDLAQLRWHKRVLVISAIAASDKQLEEQEQTLATSAEGVADREIQVVRLVGDSPEAEQFRARLKISRVAFGVALIGKDGTLKLRAAAPLSADALFRTIDSMPMRREEMKRAGPDRR